MAEAPVEAAAAAGGVLSGVYTFENVNAVGKYLNFDGIEVQIRGDRQLPSSQWKISGRDGMYVLESVDKPGKYLGGYHDFGRGGDAKILDSPHRSSAKWKISNNNGVYSIENVDSKGNLLAVWGKGTADGSKVHMWDNPTSTATQWLLEKVPSSSGATYLSIPAGRGDAEVVEAEAQAAMQRRAAEAGRGDAEVVEAEAQAAMQRRAAEGTGVEEAEEEKRSKETGVEEVEQVKEFKDFLQSVNLEQYSEVLIREGFDSVKTLQEMSDEDLFNEMQRLNLKRGHIINLKNALRASGTAAGSGRAAASKLKKPKQVSKVALVAAVSAYEKNPLAAPQRDAKAVHDILRSREMGFQMATDAPQIDPNKMTLTRRLKDFHSFSLGKDIAFFYFSGHGCHALGKNWLMTQEDPQNIEELQEGGAVDLDFVLQCMGAKCNIVVVDACRTKLTDKAGAKTHKAIEDKKIPEGTVLALACEEGTEAQGGEAPNSVFTRNMLSQLGGQHDIFTMLKNVKKMTEDDTRGAQKPVVQFPGADECEYHLCPGALSGSKHAGTQRGEDRGSMLGDDDDDDDDD